MPSYSKQSASDARSSTSRSVAEPHPSVGGPNAEGAAAYGNAAAQLQLKEDTREDSETDNAQCNALSASYVAVWGPVNRALVTAAALTLGKGAGQAPTLSGSLGGNVTNRYAPDNSYLLAALGAEGLSGGERSLFMDWYQGEYGSTPQEAMMSIIRKANFELSALDQCTPETMSSESYTAPWGQTVQPNPTPGLGRTMQGTAVYE